MKRIGAWLVAGVALAAGAAVGVGSAVLEATLRPWQIGDFSPSDPRPRGPTPRAEAAETTHNFGTVSVGAEGSHAFRIRNTGAAPLVLSRGATSCTCTVSDFETTDGEEGSTGAKTIPPDGDTTVKVTWRGKGPGGPFRQQATILTNDPLRPEIGFVIEGTVVPTWKALPDFVAFPKLSTSAGDTATVKIFTSGEKAPEIDSLEIAREDVRPFFTVSSTPLTAADISAEPGATGGFLVTVTVRPGLPLGSLREAVRLVFRMPETITVELPVEGSVVGDISFAGRGWDADRQGLVLGTVSSRTGLKTTLFLTARGPRRDAVKPTVREVVPGSLDVTVGQGERVGDGGVIRIPLEIVIPPGSPQAFHLGSEQAPAGRIVLDTGRPDSPPLTIPVSIVIGP